jgi:hypothetical protein
VADEGKRRDFDTGPDSRSMEEKLLIVTPVSRKFGRPSEPSSSPRMASNQHKFHAVVTLRVAAELPAPDADSELAIRRLIAVMMLCCDPVAVPLEGRFFGKTVYSSTAGRSIIRQCLRADRRFAPAHTRWPPPSMQCGLGADRIGRARRSLQGLFRRSGCWPSRMR